MQTRCQKGGGQGIELRLIYWYHCKHTLEGSPLGWESFELAVAIFYLRSESRQAGIDFGYKPGAKRPEEPDGINTD
jgi:hypothetical protein